MLITPQNDALRKENEISFFFFERKQKKEQTDEKFLTKAKETKILVRKKQRDNKKEKRYLTHEYETNKY